MERRETTGYIYVQHILGNNSFGVFFGCALEGGEGLGVSKK